MERIREVIVVEGRYDKNTLAQVVEATILETSGFGIFNFFFSIFRFFQLSFFSHCNFKLCFCNVVIINCLHIFLL